MKQLYTWVMTSWLFAIAKGAITHDARCGVTLGCFHDCHPTCTYLLTWANGTGSTVDFVLKKEISNSDIWIGIGLSSDKSMGSDSVTMCFYQTSTVSVKQSWNPGYSNNLLALPSTGLSATSGSYTNGVLECKFTRDQTSATQFYGLDTEWYLLFAYGPFASTDTPSKHTSSPIVTSGKVNFLLAIDVSGYATKDKTSLFKAHGSMMMFAWITTATIGIVIAMYFKPVWSETKIAGLHIWFQIHRVCMTLTVVLTLIAFIIIFVAKEGKYSGEIVGGGIRKLHPVFGIITFILAVINPFMALLRPKPDNAKRWIFNLCHWLVGMGANLFGIVSIFGGIYMMTDGNVFPDYAVYLMYAFVAWYFVLSIVLQILGWNQKSQGKTESMEMAPVGESSTINQQSGRQPKIFIGMQILLGIHIIFVVAITITLIVLLASN